MKDFVISWHSVARTHTYVFQVQWAQNVLIFHVVAVGQKRDFLNKAGEGPPFRIWILHRLEGKPV